MVANESGLSPVEFQVVVELDPQEEKTKGGIILPTAAKDRDELAAEEGTLIAVSPLAFNYVDEWPEGTKPQIGQRVMFKRYDGLLRKRTVKGVERSFRLLVDKSIVAIVEPERDDGFSAIADNLARMGEVAAANG
jgi:co-chaperonin GroES (HSP10)